MRSLSALALCLAVPSSPAVAGGSAAVTVGSRAHADGSEPPLRTLDPVQMEEDLLLLFDTLRSQHAGLYRYTSEEDLDEAFGEALLEVAEPRSILEFQRIVSRLVSDVRCGHTRAFPPPRDLEAIFARNGALPFEVYLMGDRAWVVRTLVEGTGLEPGDELESIDGLSIETIRRRSFASLVSDGFNRTLEERELERRFGEHFVLWADEPDAVRAEHEVALVGRDEPVSVPGLSLADHRARLTPSVRTPLVELRRPREGVALLLVRAFEDPAGAEPSFPELLAEAFAAVRESGERTLVLDLRGNGGGEDAYGALLVSHLSPAPFRYFERIEVTPEYEGMGDVVERDGRRLVTAHPGLQVQQPTEPGFHGRLLVLVDGWTFSTAADVATVLHHAGLATFLGEETGGGYDGNTSGVSTRLNLVHSGIGVNVPHWMYTTANVGHPYGGHGVPVDHPVRARIEDVLGGRDRVLDRALELALPD